MESILAFHYGTISNWDPTSVNMYNEDLLTNLFILSLGAKKTKSGAFLSTGFIENCKKKRRNNTYYLIFTY